MVTLAVWLVTGSAGWTIVGLLLSGVVLNAIGQVVTQLPRRCETLTVTHRPRADLGSRPRDESKLRLSAP